MATGSNIEWTDTTWNPVAGCTPVSPGCLNCYAATMSHRLDAMGQAKYQGLTVLHNGRRTFNGKISFDDAALSAPMHWRKPRRVFVNSMSDLFHKDAPFDFIDRVFAVMALTPQHTYQVLTKRPERMAEYLNARDVDYDVLTEAGRMAGQPGAYGVTHQWPLPNVWLGTSVENQQAADERIPHLLDCPAAVRFLSCEPLIGPVDLFVDCDDCGGRGDLGRIGQSIATEGLRGRTAVCETCSGSGRVFPNVDWIIVGGESGPGARPCNVEWIRSIVGQCKAAGVACFVKQVGTRPVAADEFTAAWRSAVGHVQYTGDGHGMYYIHLRDPKGGDPAEWPDDLRVREWPYQKSAMQGQTEAGASETSVK